MSTRIDTFSLPTSTKPARTANRSLEPLVEYAKIRFYREIRGAWFGRIPSSPLAVGTVTESISPSNTFFSGVTISSLSIGGSMRPQPSSLPSHEPAR